MPRVYMRFEWVAGWRVSLLEGSKVLPRTLLFHSDEKLLEMAGKGGHSRAWLTGRLWSMRWCRGVAAYTLIFPIHSSPPCNAIGCSWPCFSYRGPCCAETRTTCVAHLRVINVDHAGFVARSSIYASEDTRVECPALFIPVDER